MASALAVVPTCAAVLAQLGQAQQLLAFIERVLSAPRLDARQRDIFDRGRARLADILARIPPGWEAGADTTRQVINYLQYGTPDHPEPGARPEPFLATLRALAGQLERPSIYFDLKAERFKFAQFRDFVTASPLIESSDRMAFLCFYGLLDAFTASLIAGIGGAGLSLMRQCGAMAAWIEKYQGAVTERYRGRGPVVDLDLHFDRVFRAITVFPSYVEAVGLLHRAAAGAGALRIASALQNRGFRAEIAVFDGLFAENLAAQARASDAEARLRAQLAKAGDLADVEERIAQLRAEALRK